MPVYLSHHPLVKDKIGRLRDKDISVKAFRELVTELSLLLTVEATTKLKIETSHIQTWSGDTKIETLAQTPPTIVPILRAGLGMLNGVLTLMPDADVSVVGLNRNETTLEPEVYYQNLVNNIDQRNAIIIDPMLATGGSLLATIDMLKSSGCQHIQCLILVAAPEGIAAIEQSHPDVSIYTAAIDNKLNEQGYILPGLGDAGDKIFGTLG